MKIDFKNLPSKVKNLHQIIASLAIENDSLQTQNTNRPLSKLEFQLKF